jgi:hypothetical protein
MTKVLQKLAKEILHSNMRLVILSAELKTRTTEENQAATRQLEDALRAAEFTYFAATGSYKGATEASFIVPAATMQGREYLYELAERFGQDSVLYSKDGVILLLLLDLGYYDHLGTSFVEIFSTDGVDNYTMLADGSTWIVE